MEKTVWRAIGSCLLLWNIFQQYRSYETDSACRWCHICQEIEHRVICQGNSPVDFAITILVDQFICWLHVWVTPHAMYGSTILSMLVVALLSFTKVPWKIWWRWRSCNTFWTFRLTPVIPLILMINASLGSSAQRSCQLFLPSYHSNFSSVHLPVFLVILLSFFID